MSWEAVRSMFRWNQHPVPVALIDTAIEHARSVSRQADIVNAGLMDYLKRDDPFKDFAIDVFERGQESRVHLGPPT